MRILKGTLRLVRRLERVAIYSDPHGLQRQYIPKALIEDDQEALPTRLNYVISVPKDTYYRPKHPDRD